MLEHRDWWLILLGDGWPNEGVEARGKVVCCVCWYDKHFKLYSIEQYVCNFFGFLYEIINFGLSEPI